MVELIFLIKRNKSFYLEEQNIDTLGNKNVTL
jgi:hypothetical protein